MDEASAIIERLGLVPLEREGGWYRESHRGPRLASGRASSTAIYYLLREGERSRPHRLPSDEVWHFYGGDPVELLVLGPPPQGELHLLGPDLAAGQRPQAVVPAGRWQSARLAGAGRFALLGTTVAPGFEFEDFEPGEGERLGEAYPAFAAWLR